MHELITRLFEHAAWADRRMLSSISQPAAAEQPDVVRLAAHVIAAELVWLARLRGTAGEAPPVWPEWTLEEVLSAAATARDGYDTYVRELTSDRLNELVEYRTSGGQPFRTRVADILTHVALHGSYHRGQIASAVRRSGAEPINTDFIMHVRERKTD